MAASTTEPPWRKLKAIAAFTPPPAVVKANSENESTSTNHEPTVRESLSRRTLGGIGAIKASVDSGRLTMQAGYEALIVLLDVVLPFVTPDVALILNDVRRAWEGEMREVARTTRVVVPARGGALDDEW